jgi:uncharacterized protein DUF6152
MRATRVWLVGAALLSAQALRAHHSVLPFDGTRGVTIEGTVARVLWQNPHAVLVVDVPSAAGGVERWTIESESPLVLARLGWTAETLQVGERLAVLGAPAKDGSRALRCKHVTLADGRTLPCFP